MGPVESVTADSEAQARVTPEQRLERDSGFEPGQGRAQAVVDSVTEPEVRSVGPVDVQYVRRRETIRIAVR